MAFSHKRDKDIVFYPEPHVYKNTKTGEIYTSVTTFIAKYKKGFDSGSIIRLMRIGICTPSTCKGINCTKINCPKSKYYGKSDVEIEDMWKANKTTAADRGTGLHQQIEDYLMEDKIPDVNKITKEFAYFVNFWETIAENVDELVSEKIIYHEELKIAGSVDLIYKDIYGDYHIVDWKRSKSIDTTSKYNETKPPPMMKEPFSDMEDCNYNHYTLQLNIYNYILKTKYNIHAKSLNIVVMHPINESYKIYKVEEMKDIGERLKI